jgi:hypothetical protein
MVDSVNVFDPAFRVTNNSTGAPVSGAVIKFYVGGTAYGTPKPVYADAALETVLGTTVSADSLGCPTSDGSTPTLIYTDTSPYDIRIETSAGVLIKAYTNVKGAVEAGTGDGDAAATLATTVETKSLDYTVIAADQNKLFRGNVSGGDVTFTMPSAAASDIGNGWGFWAEHAGSANQVVFTSVSSQTFTDGVTNYGTSVVLTASGEGVRITSDGGNWVVSQHTPPAIKAGSTILTIADRLAAAPGSPPAQGAMYIATGVATWGSTSVANHDVVMHTTGGAYAKITPATDSGLIAYVQDEDTYYSFVGSAWVQLYGTTLFPGLLELATQAETETATDTTRPAAVGTMHHHPGVAKFWAFVTVSGGTPTLQTSYNVTSITDTATGQLTVTIGTDFSSANWASFISKDGSDGSGEMYATSKAAGSVILNNSTNGVGLDDPAAWSVFGFGDQA